MKKYIIIILLSVVCSYLQAINMPVITSETRESVDLSVFNRSNVILETGFGKASFITPKAIEELYGKQILKINLIYTAYRDSDEFDQINLNEKRWENLLKLMPEIRDLDKVKLNEIGIERCVTKECAHSQLHGFIVEYKKETWCYANLELQKHGIGSQGGVINGRGGTVIHIPPNAFIDAQGNTVKGRVEVQLREALTPIDIIKAKLTTLTGDDQLLESAGMIQLMAYSKGKPLELMKGKEIKVNIPKIKSSEDMQVWQGEWNEGNLTWVNPVELDNPQKKEVNMVDAIEILPDTVIAYKVVQNSFDGIVTNKIKFNLSNDRMLSIEIRRSSSSAQFKKDTYTTEIGREFGLNKYQADLIKKCFESDRIIDVSKVDFWGMKSSSQNISVMIRAERANSESIFNTLSMKGMGWVNVDRLAKFVNTKTTQLEVYCENDISMDNVMALLVIPGKNIMLSGYRTSSGNYCFSFSTCDGAYKLPVGDDGIIVMTGNVDNTNFSVTKKITIGVNNIEEVRFVEKEKSEILKDLEQLL